MSYETLKFEVADGVARITFNRPRVLNAFNMTMSNELTELAHRLRSDESVRVVVLRGEGGNFMAGADISMLQEWSKLTADELMRTLKAGFTPTYLEMLPQPVIAAVDGFALGMGCEVAIACDLRIATNRAEFGLPEITLGLIPGAGGSQRLPRLIGPAKTAELVMTGRRLKADAALQLGLVNAVVAPEELDAAVDNMVEALLSKSPLALRRAKEALIASRDKTLYDGIQVELANFVACVGTEDAREGTAAFLEKRKPTFRGR